VIKQIPKHEIPHSILAQDWSWCESLSTQPNKRQ